MSGVRIFWVTAVSVPVALFLVGFAVSGPERPARNGILEVSAEGTLCGPDQYKTSLAYEAAARDDKDALTTLQFRDGVTFLKPWVQVERIIDDGRWTKVSVRSGASIDRNCWLLGSALTSGEAR